MPHRIFVVEDHPVVRQAYGQLLAREADLEVCGTAETAEEALGALASCPCDLVLTDLMLPEMDGFGLTSRLRETCPELAVVVLSARDDECTERQALHAGARAFLSKRHAGTELVPVLRRLLAGVAPAGG